MALLLFDLSRERVEIYRYLDLSLQRKEQTVGRDRHVKNVIGVSPLRVERRNEGVCVYWKIIEFSVRFFARVEKSFNRHFLGRAVCSVGETNSTQDTTPGLSEFGKVSWQNYRVNITIFYFNLNIFCSRLKKEKEEWIPLRWKFLILKIKLSIRSLSFEQCKNL